MSTLLQGVDTTLDETAGLQNLLASDLPGDEDDNDTELTLPTAFSTRLTALSAGSPTNTALSGYDGSNTGLNAVNLSGSGTLNDMKFTDAAGALLDGDASGLFTIDGDAILLWTDTVDNNVLIGKTAGGTIVFAAYLEQSSSGAKMWITEYQPLQHPDATNPDDVVDLTNRVWVTADSSLNFDFSHAPSGQNLFLTVGDTESGLVVIGKDPANQSNGASITTGDRVNTSQGGGPTTIGINNQMFDTTGNSKDGAYFTFVKNPAPSFTATGDPNGLDQTEADVEANIQYNGLMTGIQSATISIVQSQGNGTSSLKISALNTTDTNGGTDFIDGLANNTSVTITSVTVRNSNGDTVAAPVSGLGTGVVTLIGIGDDYTIEYHTSADHNRVLVEYVSGAAFDIGGISIPQGQTSTMEVGSKMNFEDDGPTLAAGAVTAGVLTVDETVLATNATANFSALFTPAYGADGQGSGVSSFTLGISGAGADSGLIDTATNQHVYLYKDGNDVVGRVGSGGVADPAGAVAFRVSVSNAVGTAGDVTLDQMRALVHPNAANPDDAVGLTGANKITLSATITDKDNDPANATTDLTPALTFKDDGPSLVAQAAPAGELTVDETDLAVNDTANFTSLFTPTYGADGQGTGASNFTLGISGVGADTGLIDTATNQHVYLYKDGNDVVGRIGNGGVADPAGAVAFRVSVSNAVGTAGDVTLDQLRALVHPNAANPDDPVGLVGANLVTLTATITDKDNDPASATSDITAALVFKDDGPSLVAQAAPAGELTVDETNLAVDDTANFTSLFTPTYGADGQGTGASNFTLGISGAGTDSGLTDTATGQKIYLYNDGNDVVGRVGSGGVADPAGAVAFRVSVSNAVGTAGDVTLDQLRALVHPNAANPDDPVGLVGANLVTLTATITDKDNDPASATSDITAALVFKDDGPSLVAQAAPAAELTVDETNLAVNDTANFTGLFTPTYGADGQGTGVSSFTLGISGVGADSGLTDTATGQKVYLYKDGNDVVGRVGSGGVADPAGAVAFSVSVSNAVGTAGDVTLDQLRALVHPNAANPDDSVGLVGANLVTLTATITDKDNDPASATADLTPALVFKDDGPSLVAQAAPAGELTVDETLLAINDTANFISLFTPTYGADGQGTGVSNFTLGISGAGADTGLIDTATNQHVYLYKDGNDVVGRVGSGGVANPAGAVAFRISVSNAVGTTGDVTLDQVRALVHPNMANNDESVGLVGSNLVTLTADITDKDGDPASATADITAALAFEDDGPLVLGYIGHMLGFNNTNPLFGNADFNFGADGLLKPAILPADGSAITLNLAGGNVDGRAISDIHIARLSDTADSVSYHFDFDFLPFPGNPATDQGSGVVTFNKADGSFTVTLDQAIGAFAQFSTSSPVAQSNYDTLGSNSPEIVVQKYSDNFFGVLTGKAAVNPSDTSDLISGADHAFAPGEQFNSEGVGYVNVATDTLGVNSDTVQAGELLNFNFYTSNPVAGLTSPPQRPGATENVATAKAFADEIDITLDQINVGKEDIAVLLKLDDGAGHTTTRLLVANSAADYQTVGSFQVVHIGTEDYRFASDQFNYRITGLQVVTSTEELTGQAYQLSNHQLTNLTAQGSNYADTADSDVMKIIKINILTRQPADATLNFTGTIRDGDGDLNPVTPATSFAFDLDLKSTTQTLAGTAGRDAITGGAGADTLNGLGGDDLLVGGGGGDTMDGGLGNDVFKFTALSDSMPGIGNFDHISGFTVGQDRFDLSAIDADSVAVGDQAFSYLAGGAFSGTGQLRFDVATHTLQGNTDGNNATIEFQVELVGINVAPPELNTSIL